jgi:hypothetical protein
MKLEKLSSSKFKMFESQTLLNPNVVVGGYKGETNNPGKSSDQIKDNGSLDATDYGTGGRNDGFQ